MVIPFGRPRARAAPYHEKRALRGVRGGAEALRYLDERSRDVFAILVNHFLETGQPAGSQAVVAQLKRKASSATVRHVMAYLQRMGLLYAPHVSAGRLPTEAGLRLFVDSILKVEAADNALRRTIDRRMGGAPGDVASVLEKAGEILSRLACCAGFVVVPRRDVPVRHVEFVALEPGKGLVVMVAENGQVENRLIDVPSGLTHSDLVEAGNYLNARLRGRTLAEARDHIEAELSGRRAELDTLSCRVIEAGLATWSGQSKDYLIIKGQARLMDDVGALEDIARIRDVLIELESGKNLLSLVRLAERAEGVRIFIGTDAPSFAGSGCSLILSPFRDEERQLVGVVGVVGPSRMNYARIIPMVDYTAGLIGHILEARRG